MFLTKDNNQNPNFNKYFSINDSFSSKINSYYFTTTERLGAGGNGAVYECIDNSGNILAVKFLLNLSDKAKTRFLQEIDILKKLNHPHIIKYYDSGSVNGIEGKNKEVSILFIVMEKADGNIVDYMRTNGDISYEIYAPQIRGLSAALGYLHDYAFHRDIKPENILVRGETWLLSDLGLCTAVDEDEQIGITNINERIGPKYWLSPEAIDKMYFGNEEVDAASDVYQLSAVFWFIITRRYPLGIIDDDDVNEYKGNVCRQILAALKYNKAKRFNNGKKLFDTICNVTLYRDE